MARLGRYFLPDQPLHVIQRGNNRGAIFFCDDDHVRYRDWLAEAASDYGCLIHAYVLMTNHVHLLITPRREDSLPRALSLKGNGHFFHRPTARFLASIGRQGHSEKYTYFATTDPPASKLMAYEVRR